MIMAYIHKNKIFYNNIFPSNILFHFSPNHVDRIYIGICNWSMATCLIEDMPLVYDYPTKDEM